MSLERLRPENQHMLEEARGDIQQLEHDEAIALYIAELRQENKTLKNLMDHSEFFKQFMGKEDVSIVKEHDEVAPDDEININYHVSEKIEDVGACCRNGCEKCEE